MRWFHSFVLVAIMSSSLLAASSPNILFILTDQHRRDCVGAYGNPKIHTPHLDRIAQEGVRFDRAFVTCPVC